MKPEPATSRSQKWRIVHPSQITRTRPVLQQDLYLRGIHFPIIWWGDVFCWLLTPATPRLKLVLFLRPYAPAHASLLCALWCHYSKTTRGSGVSSCVSRLVHPNSCAGWGWWMLQCQEETGLGKAALNVSREDMSSKHSSAREAFALGQERDVWRQSDNGGKLWRASVWFPVQAMLPLWSCPAPALSLPPLLFPVLFSPSFTGEAVPFEWQREGRPGPRGQGLWGTVLSHALPPWPLNSPSSPWCWSISISTPLLWSNMSFLPFHFSVFQFLSLPFNMPNQFWVECIKQKKIYNEKFKNI